MTARSGGGEDAFIARYLAPLAARDPSALGLLDDAALIAPSENHVLVVTCDTLIAGRHFLFDGSPAQAADAAHKALAVNVSDLVAKGATPRAYLMSLALPPGEFDSWMPAFAKSLDEVQNRWGLTLIGGDTVRAHDHLAITITAIGEVPAGKMVKRGGAAPDDGVYVSGVIGDAALGLRFCRGDAETTTWRGALGQDDVEAMIERYRRPEPKVALAPILRDFASAAIDVSDGLARDLARLCKTSDVGAQIRTDLVPLSQAARTLITNGHVGINSLLSGGDDYEAIACVSKKLEGAFTKAAADAGEHVTKIGTISPGTGLEVIDSAGRTVRLEHTGWDHLE